MKKAIPIILALYCFGTISAQTKVQTPDQVYGELFKDVQLSMIFPDGKTFVDCIPKRDPKDIVKDYLAIKKNPAIKFSLELFVK
ncbi:MAG TPA: alpha,alpha-trehalase, partial [Chitinophagaceae bacterium]